MIKSAFVQLVDFPDTAQSRLFKEAAVLWGFLSCLPINVITASTETTHFAIVPL